jgi:hypothetical protein
MSPSPDRQTFRETVAAVAEKARAKLPECNGRVEKAVALVLNGDVELHEGGTAQVYSQSNGVSSYAVVNGHCDCSDSPRAPHGFCKHRLAAGILRRVQELLPAVPVEPDLVEPWPDNDPEEPAPEPEVFSSGIKNSPLPEAPVSITLKATFDGQEVLVTLRGHDFASVQAQVEEASAWLKAHAPAPAAGPTQGQDGWCSLHTVQMKWNEGKDGRKGWYSHKSPDGQWCKGR